MPSYPKVLLLFFSGMVLIGVLARNWPRNHPDREPTDEVTTPLSDDLPTLPRVESPYLNTTRRATFTGNQACVTCHQEQSESYHQTGHSQALSKTRTADEPPDAEFYHVASGRWYKIYREGEQLHHREYIADDQDRELVLNDYAVDWTIGSGRFSKSYLAEVNGFLVESPITWYAMDQRWGMSPGYDRASHAGFQRVADLGCIVCHAGEVKASKGNAFQPDIVQPTIGCENCHGPGSLHVAYHERANESAGQDLTIVNPARLERSHSESICANCHLRGEATVYRRGLELTDFRPGLPLADVRIDYGTKTPSGEMEVVGHMEQMWLSRCYTESETLTCITCHDPHDQREPAAKVAAYRQVCLDCHQEESCGLPKAERLEKTAGDDCVTCHMPKTDTDIPHFAFTHHRISRHGGKSAAGKSSKNAKPAVLKPLADVSHLSQAERDRALGLAYLEYAAKQPQHYRDHIYHAGQLLEKGEPDSDCLAALARVYMELEFPAAIEMAEESLLAKSQSSSSRLNALVVRGTTRLNAGRFKLAQADFEELTLLKRHEGYWVLLSETHLRQNHLAEAIGALEQAVRIAPDQVALRRTLIELLVKSGESQKAEFHRAALDVLDASRKTRP